MEDLGAPEPSPDVASDEELIRRVVLGDTALFELLMRRHNRKVYRAVRAILRDSPDVEDVMQQAYVAAYTHLATFAGQAMFSTWLLRIAVNEALGRLRRARRAAVVERDLREEEERTMPAARPSSPEQAYADRELAALVERAIDALPAMYRAVFMLRQVEGLSTDETAAVLGTSPDVVKTRLHRARALISERLAALAGEHLATAFPFDGARCDRMVARVLAAIASLP
jgi:RNA polymerase sigma-70 factor (ECF subfamily)